MSTWLTSLPRMVGVATAMLACALIGGCASSTASPRAGLSAQRQTIDKVWRRDPKAVACAQENLDQTCHYVHGPMHMAVAYAPNGRAEQIIVSMWPGHRSQEWSFLVSMVPSGAQKTGCKDVAHSIGGGTAYACTYRFKHNVIVAYFPHANDPTFGGFVAYDFASYRDIRQ